MGGLGFPGVGVGPMARGEAGHGGSRSLHLPGGTLGELTLHGLIPFLNTPSRGWQGTPGMPGWVGSPSPWQAATVLSLPIPSGRRGSRPSPGAALRSLGVSLAEVPATRLEALPAPAERETRGSSPAATGVLGMTSRCGHSPAEGGCCSRESVRQLCQDLCRGAEAQCDPQQGRSLRAALHCTPIPALRACRQC